MRRIVLLLLAMMLVPSGSAQDDGCTSEDPCVWFADVDADGFTGVTEPFNATMGDWYVISTFNFDDVTHTVAFEAAGVELSVPSLDERQSEPFQLLEPGQSQVRDQPSGDTHPVNIFANDAVDVETGGSDPDFSDPTDDGKASSEGKDSPSVAPLALLAVLGVLVILRRQSA